MRRIYKIFLWLFIAFFITLCLYAFVEPVRAWMQANVGPPVANTFGGMAKTITSNPIWINYIVPFPNQLILGAIVLGFPIAWLWHRSYNRMRGVFVRSAAKETGMYPTMTEPVSTSVAAPAPTPTSTTETPASPPATPNPPEKETAKEG